MKFILFALTVTLSTLSYAHEHKAHDKHKKSHDSHQKNNEDAITIKHPTIKTTPPGITNSAAYFVIENNSEKDIALTDVTSDGAQLVQMHEHIMTNGTMKMQKMELVKIPAKSTVHFQPGGNHIMFINVTQPIKSGDKIEITLSFNDGSQKTITTTAQKRPKAKKASHKHHH